MVNNKIKLIEPYISFEEIQMELKAILDSGQLTRGMNVEKLAADLVSYTGAKHAFLATSATTALTMCLKVIGIQPGDRVAISDFSFPATANVVEDLGAEPVFIDVDRDTYNMSVSDFETKLDGSIKAVIFVDAFGNPSGIDRIKKICEQHQLPLIEDAACAIGSHCGNDTVGAIADLTCFSFHPRKLLTTGEGGAILTNNPDYAKLLEVKLSHGASGKKGIGLDFVDFGFNYRMSEIQAMMGWKQLAKLDTIVKERNQMANAYRSYLEPLGFHSQRVDEHCIHNVQSVVFTVPEGLSRDELVAHLASMEVESTLGTYCLSGTTYYSKRYQSVKPNSLWLELNTITLPCHPNVSVDRVVSVIKNFVSK